MFCINIYFIKYIQSPAPIHEIMNNSNPLNIFTRYIFPSSVKYLFINIPIGFMVTYILFPCSMLLNVLMKWISAYIHETTPIIKNVTNINRSKFSPLWFINDTLVRLTIYCIPNESYLNLFYLDIIQIRRMLQHSPILRLQYNQVT